ncbi:DUF3868 domain-containing protein [Bacteroides ovatus]|uniref:DUF3868 domain-containing protein n=1 Tax=Bacteroides ovatus TaxID=28116 RepID=UPI001C02928D|nr:DUF3868 domain-containing protein [Bacteroides ovatus]MBT9932335.1 DUF3868 domain-containing protein [Bacteroides ovatus]
MNKLIIYWILTILLVTPMSGETSPTRKWYIGNIQSSPLELTQQGDSLHIHILYDFDGVEVSSNHSIQLIPVLKGPNIQLELPEISIKGRNNYNTSKRKLALMDDKELAIYQAEEAPYQTLKGFGSNKKQQVEYSVSIPFEKWMEEACLNINEEVIGCCKPGKLISTSPLFSMVTMEGHPITETYQVIPHISYVQPKAEPVKRREVSCEAFLDFVVSKTDIRGDYMNNPVELKKISDMIEEVKGDTSITVRAISVIGFASPEGSFTFNKKLSEGRAKALVSYLLSRFSFPEKMYTVEYGGENWVGLRKMVAESDMPGKEDILDIIDHVPATINYKTNTSRKKSLMQYKLGNPYRYMLREFYPHLRKAICKLKYDVQNFNVEQAKEILRCHPQNLSLNEMYLVAHTFDNGSPEFIELFETAVRIFPDDKTANLNAASAALSRYDVVLAEKYLQKADTTVVEYKNAMGVLLLLKGDYEQAKAYLNRAAESGLEQAHLNLEELVKKEENTRLTSKQNN